MIGLTIKLQPRDLAILHDLIDSRILTLRQLTALHFEGKESAKKRIAKLKSAGLIAERPRRISDPSILSLTRKAFTVLHEAGHLQDYPALSVQSHERRTRVSPLSVRHELAVGDLKVAFALAVRRHANLRLIRFTTWPRVHEFTASAVSSGYAAPPSVIKPDGFMCIEEERGSEVHEHAFYVEMDRGTVTLNSLAARASAYIDHFRTGGFAAWRGGTREEYKEYPFRVLGIFTSEQRRHNFARRLLEHDPPIRHQFCLATFSDVVADPLGAIWNTPADYMNNAIIAVEKKTQNQLAVVPENRRRLIGI